MTKNPNNNKDHDKDGQTVWYDDNDKNKNYVGKETYKNTYHIIPPHPGISRMQKIRGEKAIINIGTILNSLHGHKLLHSFASNGLG